MKSIFILNGQKRHQHICQRATDDQQNQLRYSHGGEQRVCFNSHTEPCYDKPLKRQRDENVGAGQKGERNRLFHVYGLDTVSATMENSRAEVKSL